MRLFSVLLALVAGLATTLSTAPAQSETLEIPVMDIAPWGMSPSAPTGLYVETTRRIAERAGIDPIITIIPYSRMIAMMKGGYRGFFLMSENRAISAVAAKAGHVADLEVVIHARPGIPLKSIEDLRGLTLAVVHGTSHNPAIDDDPEIEKISVPGPANQVAMMAAGRVDAILGVRQASDYALFGMAAAGGPVPAIGDELVIGHVPVFAWTAQTPRGALLGHRVAAAIAFLKAQDADTPIIGALPKHPILGGSK